MRLLFLGNVGIEQRVEFGGIAMRPTIHRNSRNIPGRIEASIPQGAPELVANIPLEGFERGAKKVSTTGTILIMFRQTGLARSTNHVDQDGVLG